MTSWIGWGIRHQFDRLNLVANNSRFLILPECHHKNLASRVLSLCRQRIQADWLARFGYPLLLLETFVDPSRYHGTHLSELTTGGFWGIRRGIDEPGLATAGSPPDTQNGVCLSTAA